MTTTQLARQWLSEQPDHLLCEPLRARLTKRACRRRQLAFRRETFNTSQRKELPDPKYLQCKGCPEFLSDEEYRRRNTANKKGF